MPVIYALRQAFVVEFAKIFDPDPGTNSLDALLAAARNNAATLVPRISKEGLNEIGRILRPHRKVIARWRKLRAGSVHDLDSEGLNSVFVGEADALAGAVTDAFNRLSNAHDGQSWSFEYQPERSAKQAREIVQIMEDRRSSIIKHNEWGFRSAERIKNLTENLTRAFEDGNPIQGEARKAFSDLQQEVSNMWGYWESINR